MLAFKMSKTPVTRKRGRKKTTKKEFTDDASKLLAESDKGSWFDQLSTSN